MIGEFELNKIYCMDCLEGLKKIPDNSIDLIVTDPPYNKMFDIKEQSLSNILFKKFIKELINECSRILKDNASIYLIMGWQEISYFFIALVEAGLIPRNWICWKYYQGVGAVKGYTKKHEDILLFSKGKDFLFNTGDIRIETKTNPPKRTKSGKMWYPPEEGKKNCEDVWLDIERINGVSKERTEHPTQKPVPLMERMVLASSKEGAIILDPFIGSGTTALACLKNNRQFIGFEVNQEYIKIAEDRIQKEFSQTKLNTDFRATEELVSIPPNPKGIGYP